MPFALPTDPRYTLLCQPLPLAYTTPGELERALNGIVRDHHRFMLTQHLAQIDFLDEQIAQYDDQIVQHMAQTSPESPQEAPSVPATPTDKSDDTATDTPLPVVAPLTWEEAVKLLDTIPGVNQRMAELLLAEIGIDMRRFPSAAHLASWAKVSPGNNESAGKRYSGATGHGNRWLRTALVQAAWAAVRVKKSYLSAVFRLLPAELVAITGGLVADVKINLTG